mmetsp:Transcript_53548/g.148501  ORF Transcript_53548/g.148501 Transcript_53548/m.148501 type:complete len:267 (+) Transcript_53548:350-1150(+)
MGVGRRTKTVPRSNLEGCVSPRTQGLWRLVMAEAPCSPRTLPPIPRPWWGSGYRASRLWQRAACRPRPRGSTRTFPGPCKRARARRAAPLRGTHRLRRMQRHKRSCSRRCTQSARRATTPALRCCTRRPRPSSPPRATPPRPAPCPGRTCCARQRGSWGSRSPRPATPAAGTRWCAAGSTRTRPNSCRRSLGRRGAPRAPKRRPRRPRRGKRSCRRGCTTAPGGGSCCTCPRWRPGPPSSHRETPPWATPALRPACCTAAPTPRPS